MIRCISSNENKKKQSAPACLHVRLLLHLPDQMKAIHHRLSTRYQLYCVLLLLAESALACISEARGGGSAVKGGKWFPRRRRPPNQKTKSDKGGLTALRI